MFQLIVHLLHRPYKCSLASSRAHTDMREPCLNHVVPLFVNVITQISFNYSFQCQILRGGTVG